LLALIKSWASIAFLTGKPSELPGDLLSLRYAVLATLASYIFVVSIDQGLGRALMYSIFDLAVAGLCLYLALNLQGRIERFVQAFHAYCGASSILNLASLPMLAGRSADTTGLSDQSQAVGFSIPMLVEFVYIVWGISVVAHIVRFTFDTGIASSVLISTGYLFFYLFLLGSLFIH